MNGQGWLMNALQVIAESTLMDKEGCTGVLENVVGSRWSKVAPGGRDAASVASRT